MTYADRSLAKPASLKTNRWPKHFIVQLARSDTPILREVERVGACSPCLFPVDYTIGTPGSEMSDKDGDPPFTD